MNIGKACGIFKQIESDKYTDIEKNYCHRFRIEYGNAQRSNKR